MGKTRRPASKALRSKAERPKRPRSATHRPAYRALLLTIKKARKQLGLTQVEVCRALGKPPSWLSKCELGERRLDPIDLQEIATVYGVPLDELLPPTRRLDRIPRRG